MRKFLIMLLIIVLIAIFGIILVSGIRIGSFEISSVNGIIASNKNLDTKIAELQIALDTDYVSAKSNLNSSFQKLQTSKQKYQDAITYSTEEEIKAANQTEEYKIGYLWTKIGLYATENDVTMQANVSYGSNGVPGQYNISFTVMGAYISISDFIYEIEEDSKLGFKIEEFTLVPYSGEQLQATFVIKNISIDPDSLTTAGISNASSETTNNNANTNINTNAQGSTNTTG